MKSWKKLNLLGLSFLVACSSAQKPSPEVAHESYQSTRSIASLVVTKSDFSVEAVQKTLKAIFHSYVLGQSLLHDFDSILDKKPASAMDSATYAELLAIRMSVDHLEEEINELYLKMVKVSASASKEFDPDQKANAQKTLDIIGQFMDGMVGTKELNDNLEHIVLGNLREKQTQLYYDLENYKAVTKLEHSEIESIDHNMALLRATRMKYHKQMKGFQVDPLALDEAITEMKKDKDFKNYQAELKKTSKEIQKLNRAVMRGRSTSSDVIYPNTSSAGNITGNSFPAKTWSITYDDGPSPTETPKVLKNLQDRGLKATFFMLAAQVKKPNIGKLVVEADMDIACHSYDHKQLGKSSTPEILNHQIGAAKKLIETNLGKDIKLFRLPYGAGTSAANVRSKIAAHNMIHVFWNVDTLDWQDKNPDSILARTKKQMAASSKNSGIVLFHDIHKQSVTASAMLMDYMIKNEIKVCTVQGVVDQINKGLESCQ
jgi:peptidoglycan/xylan/chitin deacetylase (PgdA/CDA1 family)